jgi:prophage regulatory protein
MANRNIRVREVLDVRGCKTTKHYRDIKAGLYPPPVKDGPLNIWPEREVAAMNSAIVAGYSDKQKRELVQQLVRSRTAADVLPLIAA